MKLFDAGEVVGHARVWGGERMYMPLTGNGGVNVVCPAYPQIRSSAREFSTRGH